MYFDADPSPKVILQRADPCSILLQAEQYKKATVIRAEGDAKGAELLADAFKEAGEGLVVLRKMEAAEEIADKLSHSRNVAYLPHGQNMLLNLPVGRQ